MKRMAALAALLAAASLAGGCGAGRSASPTSKAARQHLEGEIRRVMNVNGIPVMNSYIGCRILPDGHTQTCYGQTDGVPIDEVVGTFDAAAGPAGGNSCPGRLTVSVAGALVQSVKVDPCR